MLTQPFMQLIETHTGLHLRSQHTIALGKTIQSRMQTLQFSTPEQYYQHLIEGIPSGKANFVQFSQEWQHLIQLLMTGESYFLRDQGQFRLLQQQILPELIHQRRQQAAMDHTKPSLRIWSAGCSTGEEAYSLAMLVQQLIPDWHNWDLLILGTDINAAAIAYARKGIYRSWSFRMVSADVRSKYFYADREVWKLDERIRSMVTFCLSNLVQDAFPDVRSDLCEIDLILCRNVFIYFAPESIATVIDKFSKTLASGGYLITGHTELHGQNLGTLQPQVFPESIVYRQSPSVPRNGGDKQPVFAISLSSILPVDHQSSLPKPVAVLDDACRNPWIHSSAKPVSQDSSNQVQASLGEAEQCFQQGNYTWAIAIAQAAIAHHSQPSDLHYLMAQCYVSLENYEQARHHAQKTAEVDVLSTAPYFLLAHIARQQEQYEQAKQCLKRIIYLDPKAIAAYLELSSLYTQEGDIARAKKMQATALELIQQLGTGDSEQ